MNAGRGGDEHSLSLLFRGVFLTALATLLFEIALIRVLSFTIWYHFAYVVISTALLGFGASGTLLALRPGIGANDLPRTLVRLGLLAAVSAAACLLFVSLVPLHPTEVLDNWRQLIVFVAYQVVATVPFFFSGLVISLALRTAASRVDRLYFWDLAGGGLGCALAVPLMNLAAPPGAVLTAAAAFALAAAAFAGATRSRRLALGLGALLLVAAPAAQHMPFTPAHSKHLAVHRVLFQMKPLLTRWTALFRTDVVSRSSRPLAEGDPHWGLSRRFDVHPEPPYGYISHDATASTAIWDKDVESLAFLDHHVLQTPYQVSPKHPRVLVIGVGGGIDVVTALRAGASRVLALDLDPVTVDLMKRGFEDLQPSAFRRPEVELVVAEGRHFIETTDERFDVIQITGVDTLAAQSSGAYVLAENYLYTVEAFLGYLDRLTPDGVLSIATACTEFTDPRTTGRMVAVAQRALRERGVERPQDHIAVIFSRHMLADVLVRPRAFDAAESARLARYAEGEQFVSLQLPGTEVDGIFGQIAGPDTPEREHMLATRQFRIDPVTDDRPFFFQFYTWRGLLQARERGPQHSSALGQLVLVALLVSLTFLGAGLVLAPLAAFRERGVSGPRASRIGILVYFLAVGLGFMLFEISLLQRFVLYLGYPTYSLSVVLFSLLVFLGCGSYLSRRWVGRERVVLPLGVAAIALLTLFYMKGMPVLQAHTLGMSLAVRVAFSVAVLAPLGLVLGMFFPLGIRAAERIHPDLVPWAWGINGCASVTATVLAVMLAMTWGFSRVWLLSLVVYAIGVATLLATRGRGSAATPEAAGAP